jgi:hypothetical protein
MSGTRLRSPVALLALVLVRGTSSPGAPLHRRSRGPNAPLRSGGLLAALVACVCAASAPVIDAQAPARQPSVTTDVVYGHKDGLALTLDVHRPAHPNGAGLISIVSGGWQSSVELARIFTQAYPPLNEKGFSVFAARHGSWPRYPLSSSWRTCGARSASSASMRRSTASIPAALACSATAPADTSRCCLGRRATPAIRRPPTRCSGNRVASRRSWRTIR